MADTILNETKTDAIGEIHNITMGSAADAVSAMIDAKVSITTPQVSVCRASDVVLGKLKETVGDVLFDEGSESVFVKIDYVKGIKGTSLLVLNPNDVQIIVNKLMGLPPEATDDFEFDEMRISAICEVMNQMMGASATSMSQMLNVPIDISPPETVVSDDNNKLLELQNVKPDDQVCAVAFELVIDNVIKSKFVNLLSIELADSMVEKLFQINMGTDSMGVSLDEDDDAEKLAGVLSEDKRDAIGELQNMMMGSAATALSNFMNAKVWITTPKVHVARAGNVKFDDLDPSICVRIEYVKGMHGASILVLKQSDVQLMVNQLMGMPPVVTDDFVFDEMNISAVCEIMNQMMGASATTLSEILNTPTDISTPEAIVIEKVEDILKINNINEDQTVCAVSFDLTIDDLINSHFVTMLTIDLANEMGDKMLGNYASNDVPAPPPEPKPEPKPAPKPVEKKRKPAAAKPAPAEKKVINNNSSAAKSMNVQEFNMGSFYDDDDDDTMLSREQFRNLRPLLDVPMEVSVRIGTTQRRIEEVSDFTKGTIIELDTLASEPVEIMVNGNLMARGEVVVVDDNFAVRITELVK